MTAAVRGNAARVSGRPVDKFGARRDELAAAALQTLGELGYARTSLREIAQNSAFSHGVLHYYFTDKVDLITHCVKQYKVHCVQRYDDIVAHAATPAELIDRFAAAMADTAEQDGPLHRLWYDMRSQSMYEEAFRADVLDIDDALRAMIWRVVDRYAHLANRPPVVTPTAAYAIFDGLFQRALLRHLSGHADALAELATEIRSLLPTLFHPVADLGRRAAATGNRP